MSGDEWARGLRHVIVSDTAPGSPATAVIVSDPSGRLADSARLAGLAVIDLPPALGWRSAGEQEEHRMQRTFCDKCGTECVHYTLNLYGNIVHTTGQGERVAEDEIRAAQLCRDCAVPLIAAGGLAIRRYDETPGQDCADSVRAHP